ncbi:MAG: hypothetical protein RIB86_08670 [Imperialibacter sp.]
MSKVTNLIISFSIGEDEAARVEEINMFHNNGRGFKIVSADFESVSDVDGKERKRWYGGSKCLETPLYIGAYNHLDIQGLEEHLNSIEWGEPENVQIFLKEQDSDKFKLIELR